MTDAAARYLTFGREEWADLRAATPLTLRESELQRLRGINDRIDLDEVTAIYLPLTRLLNLYVAATQNLHKVSAAFLGTLSPKVPYIIGVAGSVAVGKSTTARRHGGPRGRAPRWARSPAMRVGSTGAGRHDGLYRHPREGARNPLGHLDSRSAA